MPGVGPGSVTAGTKSTEPQCAREAANKAFYLYLSETVLPLPKPKKGISGALKCHQAGQCHPVIVVC